VTSETAHYSPSFPHVKSFFKILFSWRQLQLLYPRLKAGRARLLRCIGPHAPAPALLARTCRGLDPCHSARNWAPAFVMRAWICHTRKAVLLDCGSASKHAW